MLKAHLGSVRLRQAAFGRAIQSRKRDLVPGDARGCRQEFLDRGSAVERGGKQHQARVLTEPVEARTERALQARGQRRRRRRQQLDGVAGLRHGPGELHESERIAGSLGQHAAAHVRGQPRRDAIEQLLGIGRGQAVQLEDRQASLLERCREPVAKAGDEHHRLVVQAAAR